MGHLSGQYVVQVLDKHTGWRDSKENRYRNYHTASKQAHLIAKGANLQTRVFYKGTQEVLIEYSAGGASVELRRSGNNEAHHRC